MGEGVDRIVISPKAADILEDVLDGSDIPIAEALESGKTRAFKDSSSAPEYKSAFDGIYKNDRTITLPEMQEAFKATYGVPGRSVFASKKAAQAVFDEIRRELGEEIDPGEEKKFLEILTSKKTHLAAGGAIITIDNIKKVKTTKGTRDVRRISVELQRPGLSWAAFKNNIIPYKIHSQLKYVEVSYEIPISGSSNSFYLLTTTKVLGLFWPAVTKITLSRSGTKYKAEWKLVNQAEATRVLKAEANKSYLIAAMDAAGLIPSKTKGNDYTADDYTKADDYLEEEIIPELDSVYYVKGSHTYDAATGLYEHWQAAVTSAIIEPEGEAVEAALATALNTIGRLGPRRKIPIWKIEEEGKPEKDKTQKPASAK